MGENGGGGILPHPPMPPISPHFRQFPTISPPLSPFSSFSSGNSAGNTSATRAGQFMGLILPPPLPLPSSATHISVCRHCNLLFK